MDSKEIAIENAFKDLNSGKITSLRAAAKQYHVPRSTYKINIMARSQDALLNTHISD